MEAMSIGGRSGTLHSPHPFLNAELGNPLDPNSDPLGPNPELLFAGAYAACYHGALKNAAKRLGFEANHSSVRAQVSLQEEADGKYRLSIHLYASIPHLDSDDLDRIMRLAHHTCPYSRALRGEAEVRLVPEKSHYWNPMIVQEGHEPG